jgi:glycosyltransferase involved in cell wall biosynthesis
MPRPRKLRLLTLTNTFPPAAHGGYGEICGDVSMGLAGRGHDVTVVTGREQAGTDDSSESRRLVVRRELDLLLSPWRHPLESLRVAERTEATVRSALVAGVDVALVWHMRGVLKPSLRLLHDAGVPVVYMLHDRWVLYERAGAFALPLYKLDRLGLTRARNALASPAAARVELRAPPIADDGIVCFVSEWLRDEHARLGWRAADPHVIPAGVDLARFDADESQEPGRPATRLLYAGRVHPTKGLDTLVEALPGIPEAVRLTVAGHADDGAYLRRVRERAVALGVDGRIDWRGEVSRQEMPDLLREHHVFVYPSVGVESGWLGVLEGLAAGTIVVTSAPGAPQELVEDGANALCFEASDAGQLAAVIERVVTDGELRARLRHGARETAQMHTLEAMVRSIEALVVEAAYNAALVGSPATS